MTRRHRDIVGDCISVPDRGGSRETFKLVVADSEAGALAESSGWDASEATSMRGAARTLIDRGPVSRSMLSTGARLW